MFWKQIEEDSINDILIREDVNLEDVLSHESLLQECKNQNDNLVKYILERNNYCKLLKYVLVTPPDESNEVARFKYSSFSCEVLTSDIPLINTLLITGQEVSSSDGDYHISDFEKPFIQQFYGILSENESLNPLTMSFCIKILLNILKFDNNNIMNFFNEKNDSVDVFLKHIESNAMVYFLTEFLQCEDEFVESRRQWITDNKLLLKIANLLGESDYRNNAVQTVLSQILWFVSIETVNKLIMAELINQFNESKFLNILFDHITNCKSSSSLIVACLTVVIDLIKMENKKLEGKIDCCVDLITNNIDSFTKLLLHPPMQMYIPMPTTVGVFHPFGPTRLEIVNLIDCCTKLDDGKLSEAIINSKILEIILNFIEEFKWNSQFHLSLSRVIEGIFSSLTTDNKNFILQKYLVQEFRIFPWYFRLHSNLEAQKPRPGYSGILWKIGNILNRFKNSEICIDLLTEQTDVEEKWSKIVDDYLIPLNTSRDKYKDISDTKELGLDFSYVEIDEADIEASANKQDIMSVFFRTPMENVDEIFSSSKNTDLDDIFDNVHHIGDDDDDWVNKELSGVPTDDHIGGSDDSSSSDEESPAFIRQSHLGKAAKYILPEVNQNVYVEMGHLPEVPDALDTEISTIDFSDPWGNNGFDKMSSDNWASFN